VNVANPLENAALFELPQLLKVSGTVPLVELKPLLIVRVAEPVALVAVLPKESRASTTIGMDDEANDTGVDADAPPMGWVENANWVAGPGPVTPKALLRPEFGCADDPEGVAVAVIV
jgi:hypothetical protein